MRTVRLITSLILIQTLLVGVFTGSDLGASAETSEEDIQAEIQMVMDRVEAIRKLTFKHEVPVEFIDRSELEEIYGTSEDDPVFWEIAQQEYEALYILTEDFSAAETTSSFYTGAVLGYYDSAEDKIVIVRGEGELDESLLAHELTHTLQDQYFPEVFEFSSNMSDDSFANTALVEGDAKTVEGEYLAKCRLGLYGDCTLASGGGGGGVSTMPPSFTLLHYFPYLEGPHFIEYLRERGGWDAVNKAFENLPQSTEQIIHPNEYDVDEPVEVKVQDRSSGGWENIGTDILGEFAIFTMFWGQGVVPLIAKGEGVTYLSPLSSGWGGDEMVIYRRGDDHGYVWETVWDDAGEAMEFFQGYQLMLWLMGATRSHDIWRVDSDDYVRVQLDGDTTTIVNAPTPEGVEEIYPLTESLPLEVVELKLLNLEGSVVDKGQVGIQMRIAATLTNTADTSQKALCLIQVTDGEGRVVHIGFVEASIPVGATLTLRAAWTPEALGIYSTQTFVWESWEKPQPLSQTYSSEIKVEG